MTVEAVPTTPAAEQGTEGGKKKIAGKFDTIEQVVEEGYVGLEKGFHSLSETVSKLTKVMEAALSAPTPIGSPGDNRDPYGRDQRKVADDDIDPAKFLINPGEVLRARDEKLAKTIISSVVDLVGNMNAVNQFKADNQDLAKHERIVQAFMNDTDKRLSTAERLSAAGKAAREYLKGLKVDLNAGNPTRAPTGDDYVENPSLGRTPSPAALKAQEDEGEAELVSYINERNKDMASHFRAPDAKK